MGTIGTTTITITEYDSGIMETMRNRYRMTSKAELVSALIDYAVDNRGEKSFNEYMIRQFPGRV